MRHKPDMRSKDDRESIADLKPEPWMLDLLRMNPSYTHWGPGEDYMWVEKKEGWNSQVNLDKWTDFKWELDELNECPNFYFELHRPSEDCKTCCGTGEHPDAQWISESFYRHSSPFTLPTIEEEQAAAIMAQFGAKRNGLHGRGSYPPEELFSKYGPAFRYFCEEMKIYGYWNNRITQDECDALIKEGRLTESEDPVTAESVNGGQSPGGFGLRHDGINRMILVDTRCKRLGVPLECPDCKGKGYFYTASQAHVRLVLWMIHPRKGASRGVRIERIEQSELPAVYAFLRQAAKRNAQRFSKIPKLAVSKA